MKYWLLLISLFFITTAEAQTSAVADSLAAVGDYSKAIDVYQKIDTPNALLYLKIARAYKSLGNSGQALTYYKKSVNSDANQLIAATEYGRLLIAQGKFKKADSLFASLSDANSSNPEFHFQRGRTLQKLGPQFNIVGKDTFGIASHNAFAKAIQLDSTHQKALYQLSVHYLKKRDYDKVTELVNTALASYPENVQMISVMAQNFYLRGFYDDAATWYEKLIALGQSTPTIHEKLGLSYQHYDLHDKAIKQFTILINEKKRDKDPNIHMAIAKSMQRVGEYDQAIRHTEIAILLLDQPLDAAYYQLGTIYRIHKKHKLAFENFQIAIKENPKNYSAYYYKAVAADNYFKDQKAVVKLYEQFIAKAEKSRKHVYMTKLANDRLEMLNREIFMKGD